VQRLRSKAFDLVILDLRMPGIQGLALLEAIRVWGHDVPVLMISGFGTIDTAVRALHLGADDFLTKPVEPAVLTARVEELLARRPQQLSPEGSVGGIVGRSAVMQELLGRLKSVAPTDATVLVTGETGTGKELISRAIHQLSRRREGPFLAVNCAAIAEGILESELFGHVRGAFTGATRDRVGLFEAAQGGTLFLDEVGEMSHATQLRLLRALQEHEITRVGATRAIRVDVRIVAATNRNLSDLSERGSFRDDLYYRLAVFPLHVPPLREHGGDIPSLVDHALARLHQRMPGSGKPSLSPLAMRLLHHYEWPGNVRQLFAVLEHAMILASSGRIEAQHLPEEVRRTARVAIDSRYRAPVDDDERATILAALERCDGVIGRTAEHLGMARTTLWRKLRHYGITASDDGGDA
jgi:two-component system response regulator HydG